MGSVLIKSCLLLSSTFYYVGGSEWVQEDILELKNIYIPDPKAEIDLSCILGTERKISHVLSSENFFKVISDSILIYW